jgi:anti-sigma factor RsiW
MKHYDLDILEDYLHGELDEARDAAVHAHLDACTACRADFDQLASVRDWVRAAALAEERELPSLVKARVWETIRTQPATPMTRLRAAWAPWLAVPAAAAIAFAAYFGLPSLHAAPPIGVAASDLLLEHAAQMADNPLADHGVVVPASVVESSHPTSSLIEAVDASSVSDPGSDGN